MVALVVNVSFGSFAASSTTIQEAFSTVESIGKFVVGDVLL